MPRRAAEQPLQRHQIRHERVELIGERGVPRAEAISPNAPGRLPHPVRVPGIQRHGAGEGHAMQAGDQRPERSRVQVEREGLQVDPRLDADRDAVEVRENGPIGRPSDARRPDPGAEHTFLERRPFQDPGQLLRGDLPDLLDGPAAGVGVKPPDRAETARRHRAVGKPAFAAEAKPLEDRGRVRQPELPDWRRAGPFGHGASSANPAASSRPAVAGPPGWIATAAISAGSSSRQSAANVQAR